MKGSELEALYMTTAEVAELLGIGERRVFALVKQEKIAKLKGGIFSREDVESYLSRRGDKRGGRYPMDA
jgi:excisionase family DNA binding protein